MSGETQVTLIGNLVDDVELRFTPSGHAVAKFRIASTPRFFDKQTSEWKDGESLFLPCQIWRQAAENCAETLMKGMRVVLTGVLKQRSYETKEGEKRTVFEVEVDEIGPSLKSATAKVTKTSRDGGGFSGASSRTPKNDDPWASAGAGAHQADPWAAASSTKNDDIPPF